MKKQRHAKIKELIAQYEIETQGDLADMLNKAGFKVTQATVSRDIRELSLTKIPKMRRIYWWSRPYRAWPWLLLPPLIP